LTTGDKGEIGGKKGGQGPSIFKGKKKEGWTIKPIFYPKSVAH